MIFKPNLEIIHTDLKEQRVMVELNIYSPPDEISCCTRRQYITTKHGDIDVSDLMEIKERWREQFPAAMFTYCIRRQYALEEPQP